MNLMTDEILKELRAQHAQKLAERNRLEADLTKLAKAIAALAGEPAAPEAPRGPTVPEMVEECYRQFQKAHVSNGLGLVMTNDNVLQQARVLYPAVVEKIKRGLSGAQHALIKKQKLKRAPGGMELN